MSWRALSLLAAVSVCAFPRNSGQNGAPALVVASIVSEGYPAEFHNVITEDGYILGMHRIPYGKDGDSGEQRPVVFVMHGLMGASSNFIYLGKAHSIAYNLADAGYDVWLGNARGNVNSRAHVTLDPDDSQQKHQFFDFSWEEIGMIDVPAMVDYALAHTGQEKLHYVGHSQGGTAFLVLNSMKPEYNEKFLSAHLLAGVGYKANFPHSQLRATALLTNSLYALGNSIGLVEISNLNGLSASRSARAAGEGDHCAGDAQYRSYCQILGLDSIVGEIDQGIGIGGSSLKQFAHYGQNIRDRAFRRWDYGILTNREVYGSFTPPSYDLSRINVNVTMHYTVSDSLLDERDVLNMAAAMPDTKARKVARETFSHVDFIQAADVKELVTNYIIARIRLVTEQQSKAYDYYGLTGISAYNLADAGYDVWLGNARGNVNSRAHVTLDPDDSQQKHQFFDFSWEEIGMIDVPAMVDYALAHTGQEKLHYVGHSQGGTAFLVLNSMKPDYNEKFLSAHLLAGVGYKANFPHSQLRATALLTNSLYALGNSIGLVEISNLNGLSASRSARAAGEGDHCAGDAQYRSYCQILGLDSIVGEIDQGIGIGGSSLKQFAHYGQNIRDRAFRRWDYGILTNREVYGSFTPPSYDLSRINVNVTMHYTVSDSLLDERDVLNMAAAMPDTKARKVARETFSHVDFIQAADVKELVTNYIIARIRLVTEQQSKA